MKNVIYVNILMNVMEVALYWVNNIGKINKIYDFCNKKTKILGEIPI